MFRRALSRFPAGHASVIEYLAVLVISSISEGTPLLVFEAMAAGVPVVSSAVGRIPNQIRQEKEGILVPPVTLLCSARHHSPCCSIPLTLVL